MNLKLKRLVRTQTSEQYALFDLTQLDEVGQPMTIGKLDLHYTGEGIYGTLLLWDDLSRALRPAQRSLFIRALLDEIAQPMGVPPEYVIEYFAPSLDGYEVYHNVTVDDEELEDDPVHESMDSDWERDPATRPSPATEPPAAPPASDGSGSPQA